MMRNHEHIVGNGGNFDLSPEVLSVLPTDPYEQLDVAKRITYMAITGRISKLEAEEKKLLHRINEKDRIIYELQERLVEVEHNLQETTARLSHALDEQTKLANEKNSLISTVKKLNRDVAKLETFKKTLMQSLQDDDESFSRAESIERASRLSVASTGSRDGATSLRGYSSETSELGQTREDEDGSQPYRSYSLTPTLTPKLTPTGSPKTQSAGGTPTQRSEPGSPRRQPTIETKLPLHSSLPGSHTITAPNSPPRGGSLPARTPKVDGKEFFRQARTRLSYEQFSAFLANIKELNAHHQTREETLRKADEIFGPENQDLYAAFEGLLSRHITN